MNSHNNDHDHNRGFIYDNDHGYLSYHYDHDYDINANVVHHRSFDYHTASHNDYDHSIQGCRIYYQSSSEASLACSSS